MSMSSMPTPREPHSRRGMSGSLSDTDTARQSICLQACLNAVQSRKRKQAPLPHRWQRCSHTMRSMADVSIVGAAGYTGQETLDRVLGHPELRLVAVGSDSLAGQAGSALDPRLAHAEMPSFVTNEEALAHGADVTILCLSHEAAAAIDAPGDGRRRRPLRRAPAARRRPRTSAWYGFTHPKPEGLGEWSYGLPELVAGDGPADREPGLLRDRRRSSRSRPIRDAIDPDSVVVDGLSGMTGAGRTLKDVDPCRRGARERRPLPRRRATSTCPRSPSCSASRSR